MGFLIITRKVQLAFFLVSLFSNLTALSSWMLRASMFERLDILKIEVTSPLFGRTYCEIGEMKVNCHSFTHYLPIFLTLVWDTSELKSISHYLPTSAEIR